MRKKLLILMLALTGAVMASLAPREANAILDCPERCFGEPEAPCCYSHCTWVSPNHCNCGGPIVCY